MPFAIEAHWRNGRTIILDIVLSKVDIELHHNCGDVKFSVILKLLVNMRLWSALTQMTGIF